MHPSISINTLSLAAEGLGKQLDTVARLGARAASPDLEQVHEFEDVRAHVLGLFLLRYLLDGHGRGPRL